MTNTKNELNLTDIDLGSLAQLSPLFKRLLPYILVLLIAGCSEIAVTPSVNTTHVVSDRRQSDASCATSLDRTIPPVVTSGVTLEPTGRVFSGFETRYVSGADPFPCNRLHRSRGQGLFLFDLVSIRDRVLGPPGSAVLEISSFAPQGEFHITEAQPWGINGWIGSPGSIHTTCSFKVSAITENWRFATPPISISSLATTRELASTRNTTFTAPMNRTFALNVSPEILEMWTRGSVGGEVFGFSIEPVGIPMDFSSSNRCAGYFTMRLRLFFGTD